MTPVKVEKVQYHHWLGGSKKTIDSRDALQDLLASPDFESADIKNVNFHKINKHLASNKLDAPWVSNTDGWKHEYVTIGTPPIGCSTRGAQRDAAAQHHRAARVENLKTQPAVEPCQGDPVPVAGL